ncbi:hypothetical protein PTHTG4_09070 [Parageobacillus thermoglucosidasius]|uniref:Uncharacterized protein n=1 Tax=Geobacillus sp. (strain Y4.1MC1) TaxID=581103 RepID=A0A7U3YE22_GEOS0|nr:hypothetical protein [Parageobacillus thermoglucosidasius]GCD81845.1 hypothetical protein PTHTG4_09070 [Parageobacillus thermoglucosidasius]
MKKLVSIAALLLIIASFSLFIYRPAKETIIFFPIHPHVTFSEAKTTLQLQPQKRDGKYSLLWSAASSLDRDAYLRQDISLLFADGRLVDRLAKWKTNSQTLTQEKIVAARDSRFFQAISFHHGELHEGEMITSSQTMTSDYLYVIDSPYSPLVSFHRAATQDEKEWQNVLNKTTAEFLQHTSESLLSHFSIQKQQYYSLYLPDLIVYNEQPLPDLSMEKTQEIIGKLWEGLYKSYFLGIKKEDGSILSPIGSTTPLILISKDYSHLLVLTETKDGEKIRLTQQISR